MPETAELYTFSLGDSFNFPPAFLHLATRLTISSRNPFLVRPTAGSVVASSSIWLTVVMAPKTSDGYLWTTSSGILKGNLDCEGVIHPSRSSQTSQSILYDVIVIGAGYAGLAAARDLSITSIPRSAFSQ